MGPSTHASPHLRHHHMHHLHRSHSRVQSLDLMDDLPLPFQTDPHHLNILVQESPMLSPNPPPSVVVEANGGIVPSSALANASHVVNPSSTATSTTNVIINNIKANTTSYGTANMDSGVVTTQKQQQQQQQSSTLGASGETSEKKASTAKENNCMKNRHWRTCPELHKAMDGVNYIADHTKKEEESTRVSLCVAHCFSSSSLSLVHLQSFVPLRWRELKSFHFTLECGREKKMIYMMSNIKVCKK